MGSLPGTNFEMKEIHLEELLIFLGQGNLLLTLHVFDSFHRSFLPGMFSGGKICFSILVKKKKKKKTLDCRTSKLVFVSVSHILAL